MTRFILFKYDYVQNKIKVKKKYVKLKHEFPSFEEEVEELVMKIKSFEMKIKTLKIKKLRTRQKLQGLKLSIDGYIIWSHSLSFNIIVIYIYKCFKKQTKNRHQVLLPI